MLEFNFKSDPQDEHIRIVVNKNNCKYIIKLLESKNYKNVHIEVVEYENIKYIRISPNKEFSFFGERTYKTYKDTAIFDYDIANKLLRLNKFKKLL